MPIEISGGGSGGGGSGTVTNVSSANTAIAVANPTTTPVLTVATLDVLATDGPAAADWSNNSHKITSLANGSAAQDAAAFGQIPTALPPNGSAGGDLGSTYPNPTVTSGAHLGAATVPIASLADPTTGRVIGSASNAAAAVFPPGYELKYTQITSTVNIGSTTEGTGTTVLSPGSITFDGAPVLVTLFCMIGSDSASTGDFVILSLFEATTQITRMALVETLLASNNSFYTVCAQYRFTPTAAAHTYTITGSATSTTGTPRVLCGSGGTGGYPPAFVRFTKV